MKFYGVWGEYINFFLLYSFDEIFLICSILYLQKYIYNFLLEINQNSFVHKLRITVSSKPLVIFKNKM